ncbi:MAG: Zn-dependent hydrolase, partial [Spirulina sp. DLM2.Bin59]
CTAGFREPVPAVDFVLMSSRLLDEGAPSPNLPGNPRILFQAGAYTLNARRYEGIAIPHDRLGGRRFGMNVVWRWQQAGINILHMGGAAGPIGLEERILMGQPDLAFVPVGGGPKAYNAEEAIAAIRALNPKIVVPTHYRTAAADGNACDIDGLDRFLALVPPEQVTRLSGQTLTLIPRNLPTAGPRFYVFRDPV